MLFRSEGVALSRKTEALLRNMETEQILMQQDAVQLDAEVAAAQAVLGDQYAAERKASAFTSISDDYWPRFSRRAENLNTLLTSLKMTQAQYELAKVEAQNSLDRFSEVIDLLMPLWRQRTGLELFSR